jgi:hypothetical protein
MLLHITICTRVHFFPHDVNKARKVDDGRFSNDCHGTFLKTIYVPNGITTTGKTRQICYSTLPSSTEDSEIHRTLQIQINIRIDKRAFLQIKYVFAEFKINKKYFSSNITSDWVVFTSPKKKQELKILLFVKENTLRHDTSHVCCIRPRCSHYIGALKTITAVRVSETLVF